MSKYVKFKKAIIWGVTLLIPAFFTLPSAYCKENSNLSPHQPKEKQKMDKNYGHIDAKALNNLIATKTPMVLLDARTEKWDDKRRLPGAQGLPWDSDPATFSKFAPNKDALIVIYCFSTTCPAGKNLAEKMAAAGYQHILEYAGGVKEWADELGYPTEKAK